MRFYLSKHLFGLALLGAFLAGGLFAAHAQDPAEEPQQKASDTDSTSSDSTAYMPAAATELPKNYVIGSDDVLAVDVWHERELSRVVPVRPDGKISLPLIGELQVAGETPLQLQDALTERLKEYLEHPQVTVIVQEAKSQRFNVVGEVQKPGSFEFGHPVTIIDAIALAGGFRDFAKTKKMYIIRTAADGTRQKLLVHYNEVLNGKRPEESIVLHSRDTVVVP